ncbi:hypothetical protein FRAAL2924 [Frankia alni ACN14a]|uniref:Uncharacterized protein n=1 Tax=Frankia alni (strain DSM 45986 / CECT 9034 / ACN14a) TaxID=326424 RepID=Q0RLN6_FRAAA|nr:hypothetical protein FRAAL2924 [Frankia alni ACN14a]
MCARLGAPVVTSGHASLSSGLLEESGRALVPTGDPFGGWAPRRALALPPAEGRCPTAQRPPVRRQGTIR